MAERAAIILASATGAASTEVAAAAGVNRGTVGKWRTRFLAQRLDGLLDAPRPGAPRTITDGDVERVIRKTLEERPPETEATHWSTRTMAQAAGVTQTAVVRIWHAYGLQPHRAGDLVPTTVPSRLGRGDRCEPERTFIHDHYVGELLEGTFRPKVRRRVEAIVARLRDDEDIDGVLALLLPSAIVAELPAFNTTALHVDAIVNYLWA